MKSLHRAQPHVAAHASCRRSPRPSRSNALLEILAAARARSRIGMPRWRHRLSPSRIARVEHCDPVLVGDDRIEVHFLDLAAVAAANSDKLSQQVGDRVDIDRGARRARRAGSPRRATPRASRAPRADRLAPGASPYPATPRRKSRRGRPRSSGPNRSSRTMPAISSTPGRAIGCTATPSNRAPGCACGKAARMRSKASRTSCSERRLSTTPPTSLL